MGKMSLVEENKLMRSVSDILDKVGKGTPPEDAVVAVALREKFGPSKIARVCEACNKMASIEYLSSASAKERSAAFPLADPSRVLRRVEEATTVKAAPIQLRKTAADGVPEVTADKVRAILGISRRDHAIARAPEFLAKIANLPLVMDDLFERCDRVSDEVGVQGEGASEALADLIRVIETSSEAPQEISRNIVALGKDKGYELLELINKHLDTPLPDNDTSNWVPTDSKLTPYITSLLSALGGVQGAKEAAEQTYKIAAGAIADGLALLTSGPAAIGDLLEPEKKPVDADVPALSVDTINKMRELELKDNFANMYLDDPFLSKYPPETVLDAYNKVMQMVPTVGRRQNADALITSMVKRLITSNNAIDPLEITNVAKIESEMNKARSINDDLTWG